LGGNVIHKISASWRKDQRSS